MPRLLALAALGGAVVAIVVAVGTVHSDAEATGQDPASLMQQLNAANGLLGRRLDALKPGTSPRAAQETTRSTVALARRLDQAVDDSRAGADRVHAVLQAERTYLDAVGSTLNNPASGLREVLGPRAQALRDLLRQVPGGDHHAVRGGAALVVYSQARAGR